MSSVLALAYLSKDVYADSGPGVVGYKRLSSKTLDQCNSSSSSFFGAVYFGGYLGIIAFRGSQELEDWTGADYDIATGVLPVGQTGDAFAFYNRSKELLIKLGAKKIIVTGHSLGGGLTQLVAGHITTFPVVGVTFNAPGMAALKGSIVISQSNKSSVFNYRADRDPVSLKGAHIGRAPVSITGGGMHPIGPLIGALSSCATGSIRH